MVTRTLYRGPQLATSVATRTFLRTVAHSWPPRLLAVICTVAHSLLPQWLPILCALTQFCHHSGYSYIVHWRAAQFATRVVTCVLYSGTQLATRVVTCVLYSGTQLATRVVTCVLYSGTQLATRVVTCVLYSGIPAGHQSGYLYFLEWHTVGHHSCYLFLCCVSQLASTMLNVIFTVAHSCPPQWLPAFCIVAHSWPPEWLLYFVQRHTACHKSSYFVQWHTVGHHSGCQYGVQPPTVDHPSGYAWLRAIRLAAYSYPPQRFPMSTLYNGTHWPTRW